MNGAKVNSIRSVVLASLLGKTKPERNRAASAEGVAAAGGEPLLVGAGMGGSSSAVNQRTTVAGEHRVNRGQSVRSSEEVSHDHGAKGRREVVLGLRAKLSRQGADRAVRLSVRRRRKTGQGLGFGTDSGPPRWGERVGDNDAAGAILP